jgi:MFS family permease
MLASQASADQSPGRPIGDSVSVLVRYTTAAALARLADEGGRVALLLAALQGGRGTAFGGILVAALMVPHVVAAPPAGALADRARRRRPLYLAGLAGYGLALAGAAVFAGPVPAAALGLAVLAGCAAPLLFGGLTSLLGELAPGDPQRAYGLDAMSYGAAGIAGPAIAAVLAVAVGAVWAAAGLAAMCAVAALVLATLPIRRRPARPAAPRGGAFAAMWRSPSLAAVTAGSSLSQLGMGALPIVAALLAARAHQSALTGIALSACAAGNLAGSLAYTARPIRAWRPETVMLVFLAAVAVPFALVPVLHWTLPLFAVAGLLNGPMVCALLAVRDREAPPAVRTQIFTVGAGLRVTGAAAGAALAGFATGLGPDMLLLAVAAVQLCAAGAGAALLGRGVRRVVRASPAPRRRAATSAPTGTSTRTARCRSGPRTGPDCG